MAVYRAKEKYENYSREIRDYRQQHKKALREKADQTLGDLTQWKDKKAGIQYSRETMERNVREMVKRYGSRADKAELTEALLDLYDGMRHTFSLYLPSNL